MSLILRPASFALSLVSLCTIAAFAQKGSPPAPAPRSIPSAPNYHNLADPDLQTDVRYQAFDKKPLTFKSTAEEVLVPVVVVDKSGNPVAGLKKEAFRLQENGRDQPISSVEEYRPTSTPLSPPRLGSNQVSNVNSGSTVEARRLVIIVFDVLNTPFGEQARARHALIKYVADNLDPGSLYQLLALDRIGIHILHDYTQNTASLESALKALTSKFSTTNAVDSETLRALTTDPGQTAVPTIPLTATGAADQEAIAIQAFARGEQAYAQYLQAEAARTTMLTFQQIAARVSGIPGRKALIWVTAGFPFSVDPSSGAISEGYSFDFYQHTMQLLANQFIAVYPVDARGLLTLQPDASFRLTRTENAQAAGLLAAESNRNLDIQNTMRAFADMTGGRAYVNKNDMNSCIKDAVKDGSAYYMLSYPLDRNNRKPGWRKINVRVADYKVRARDGYYMTQTTVDPTSTARSDIDQALTSPFDYTGLPMRIMSNPPVADGAKRKVTFAMTMPPKAVTLDATDNHHLHVDIAYVVRNTKGDDAGHNGVSYNTALNPQQLEQIEKQGLGYGDTLSLSPGSYNIRVVVRDNLTGKIGSALLPLDVK